MRLAATALASLAMLTVVPAAQAAPRYASPTGKGPAAECPQAEPCSLSDAVEKAKANDEVIVTAGNYTVPFGPTVSAEGVYIHGDFAAPMPQISSSSGFAIQAVGLGDRVVYLEVNASGFIPGGVNCGSKGIVERVRITATGEHAMGVFQQASCLVRDSVVRADGKEALAVFASSQAGNQIAPLRNVTAIATGPKSVGLVASYFSIFEPGSETAELRNVIVDGGEFDLEAAPGGFGPGNITVANSNFDSTKESGGAKITAGSGNQTAPPAFVDAANGDYREAAGSPTIDAGGADPLNGEFDFAGDLRSQGPAPDIGAFEVYAPPPAPPPAAAILSLKIAPPTFRAVNIGGAIISAKKKRAPVGATVTYSLSLAASVDFSVERKTAGRSVKGKCVKRTAANAGKKKCALFKPTKGGFAVSGVAGQNNFRFSGRIGNKALKRGSYRLVGTVGGSVKRAGFRIVK